MRQFYCRDLYSFSVDAIQNADIRQNFYNRKKILILNLELEKAYNFMNHENDCMLCVCFIYKHTYYKQSENSIMWCIIL